MVQTINQRKFGHLYHFGNTYVEFSDGVHWGPRVQRGSDSPSKNLRGPQWTPMDHLRWLIFRIYHWYSYGHLPVISGYKWDYTFYKLNGVISTYN